MLTDALWPDFARSVLHSQASTYDLLVISFGAGTMIGTFSLGGLRSDVARGSVLATTGVLSGLSMAALAFVSTPLTAFLVAALIGAAQGMYMTMGTTLVQEVVPDQLRGRVSSAYLMATGGTMSFGILAAGALADAVSIHFVLLVPPLLFVAFVLFVSGVRPGVRGMYRTGSILQRRQQPALAGVEP
jgi:MFS family permease